MTTTSILPSNIDAEKVVLGSFILNNETIAEAVSTGVHSSMFYLDSHRHICGAVLDMYEAGTPVDTLTLSEELGRKKKLERVGGAAYISSLSDGVPARSSLRHHFKILRDKDQLRRLIHACAAVSSEASDGESTPAECVSHAHEMLLQLQSDCGAETEHIRAFTDQVLGQIHARRATECSEVHGISLGLKSLDRITGGVMPGELCLIPARPARGKSHLLAQIALANAKRGVGVAVYTIEMRKSQFAKRLWGHEGKIPSRVLRDERDMSPEQYKELQRASLRVAELPIYINDASALTTQELLTKAQLDVKRHKVGLVIVDYAQRLIAKGKDEVERAARQSQALTQLAKDYVPVVAACQLSRAPQHDLNRWPNMQDIKGSSQFEQDAHLIVMIHREVDDKNQPTGKDFLIVEKNREGEPWVEPVSMTSWADFAQVPGGAQ